MRKWLIAIAILAFVAVGFVHAQEAKTVDIDPATAELIFVGSFGLGVVGLTAVIKRALKATGFFSILISVVVSAAGTAYTLMTAGDFTWLKFFILSVIVASAANGIYLFPRKRTPS